MNQNYDCCPNRGAICPCPIVFCGPTGAMGRRGLKGSQGIQGSTGPMGPQGAQGQAGQSAFSAAQDGGYIGTQTEFYEALGNISQAILSPAIRFNQVVTMAQYQALLASGDIDSSTAYDIIEDMP